FFDGCTDCGTYVVGVYNVNNCTDDNFTLSLDGTVIATLNETDTSCMCPDPAGCRGHLVLPSDWSTATLPDILSVTSAYSCHHQPMSTVALYATELNHVAGGDHSLELTSIHDNACGNFGGFYVWRACLVDNKVVLGPLVVNSTYGTDTVYTFTSVCNLPSSEI